MVVGGIEGRCRLAGGAGDAGDALSTSFTRLLMLGLFGFFFLVVPGAFFVQKMF